MLAVCLAIVLSFIALLLIGYARQNNIFTKILFLNAVTSLIGLFIFFLGSFKANNSYFDIGLIYIFLSFILGGAYLKYFAQD